MRKFDFILKTKVGELVATLEAEEDIPTGLLIQAVMSHQQLFPHFVELGANKAETLAITTPNRLNLPTGMTVQLSDQVAMCGPLLPSPVPNVPREFGGRTLTHNLAALVMYKQAIVLPDANPDLDDDFEQYDTAY